MSSHRIGGQLVYELHKLLRQLRMDPVVRTEFAADPAAVCEARGIDARTTGALLHGHFAELLDDGVNPLLLYFAAIETGVDRADYYARVRAEVASHG
jgi:hypothetical protein